MAYPEHFATLVHQRRKELNFAIDGMQLAGGPAGPTVAAAEAARMLRPRPSTLSKFDACFEWEAGSAARVFWERAMPVELPKKRRRAFTPASSSVVTVPVDPIIELMYNQQRLDAACANAVGGVVDVSGIESIRDTNRKNISQLFRKVITGMLERNWATGAAPLPLLERPLAEHLTQPVDDDDPDRDEKLYIRWLMRKVDVDPRTERRFRRQVLAATNGNQRNADPTEG